MNQQELHGFLFKLYDYADYLAGEVEKDSLDRDSYFISMLYVEAMMDTYGRGLISQSAKESGKDQSAALAEAHRRIDLLRQQIDSLRHKYNFDEAIKQAGDRIKRDWLLDKTSL